MKTVQRTSAGTLNTSAAHNDAAAENDRVSAWLDIYSERTGAHADAIRAEVIRVNGTSARITRELIADAAQRIAYPGSFGFDAVANLNNDEQFRKQLASRLDAAGDGEAE